ncbi:MAG: repeat protein [Sphingobacteriaceae bacterium]|jgi:WD40 repeat protein|nr:repeat protein [Sphingobacteriaceae bacterium]
MIQVNRIAELPGHQNPIFTVEPSQKPGIFFTAGNDKGVVEWSLKTMSFIKVMFPVKSSVYAIHCVPGKPLLTVGERSGEISIFNFVEQKITKSLTLHRLPVFDIKSILSKNELVASSEDGTVSVWSLDDYSKLFQFKVAEDTVRVIAVSPDENLIALGCKDNVIYLYDSKDYTLVATLTGHTMPITSLHFSPDGKFLLSGSRDAQLKVWATSDYQLQESIPAHLFTIYDIKFHPTKPIFATASRDKSIKIWDAETYTLLKTISREKGMDGHRLSVNKIAWESHTERLISVGDDKLVLVWEIA